MRPISVCLPASGKRRWLSTRSHSLENLVVLYLVHAMLVLLSANLRAVAAYSPVRTFTRYLRMVPSYLHPGPVHTV
jgi:hypothetical protein